MVALEERVRQQIAAAGLSSAVEDALNLILDEAQKNKPRYRAVLNEAAIHKSNYHETMRERRLGDPAAADRELRKLADAALDLAARMDTLAPLASVAASALPRASIAPMGNRDDAVVRLDRVTATLTGGGSAFVLSEISFELGPDEILAVVGPNGSGKSTLMRVLAGELATVDEASLRYPALSPKRNDWIAIRSRIAYVPQFPEPWMPPLLDVLRYTAAVAGYKGEDNESQVDYVLARLGLTAHKTKKWTQLSGGYRTRFALARCLLTKPALILLDEPLAHLDVISQATFLRDLRALSRSVPFAVVLTSQHIYEAEAISDSVLVLDGGRPLFTGPVAALEDPDQSTFEFSCIAAEGEVARIFAGVQINSPMLNRYVVSLPPGSTCTEVVRRLSDGAVEATYCRDLSRSSRRFLRGDVS